MDKTERSCDSCEYYRHWRETMDPGVPGSQQDFEECDPPTPSGMSEKDFEKVMEDRFENYTHEPCPAYSPIKVDGRRCCGCKKEISGPVTDFWPVYYWDLEVACSEECAAKREAEIEEENRFE